MSLSQSDPPNVNPRALVPSQLPSLPSHLSSVTAGEHWVGNQTPPSSQAHPRWSQRTEAPVHHLKHDDVRVMGLLSLSHFSLFAFFPPNPLEAGDTQDLMSCCCHLSSVPCGARAKQTWEKLFNLLLLRKATVSTLRIRLVALKSFSC